jgi:hypothetical protein
VNLRSCTVSVQHACDIKHLGDGIVVADTEPSESLEP